MHGVVLSLRKLCLYCIMEVLRHKETNRAGKFLWALYVKYEILNISDLCSDHFINNLG